jgi:hypothetical protein
VVRVLTTASLGRFGSIPGRWVPTIARGYSNGNGTPHWTTSLNRADKTIGGIPPAHAMQRLLSNPEKPIVATTT